MANSESIPPQSFLESKIIFPKNPKIHLLSPLTALFVAHNAMPSAEIPVKSIVCCAWQPVQKNRNGKR